MPTISGVVRDATGAFAKRVIRAFSQSSGRLVAYAYSDASTGAYSMYVPTTEPHTVVAYDTEGVDVDPAREFVEFHLTMDGSNNGTSFVDTVRGQTLTVYGNAKTVTGVKQFGTASAYFDGSGDYLLLSNKGVGHFGYDDFTIELFLSPINGGHGSAWSRIAESINYPNAGGWQLVAQSSDNPCKLRFDVSTGSGILNNTVAIPNSTFTHVAVTRQKGVGRMFLGGIKTVEANIASQCFYANQLSIGGNIVNGESFYGHVDEFRITKGFARYAVDFTPPTQAFPLVGLSNTNFNAVVFDNVVPV